MIEDKLEDWLDDDLTEQILTQLRLGPRTANELYEGTRARSILELLEALRSLMLAGSVRPSFLVVGLNGERLEEFQSKDAIPPEMVDDTGEDEGQTFAVTSAHIVPMFRTAGRV